MLFFSSSGRSLCLESPKGLCSAPPAACVGSRCQHCCWFWEIQKEAFLFTSPESSSERPGCWETVQSSLCSTAFETGSYNYRPCPAFLFHTYVNLIRDQSLCLEPGTACAASTHAALPMHLSEDLQHICCNINCHAGLLVSLISQLQQACCSSPGSLLDVMW